MSLEHIYNAATKQHSTAEFIPPAYRPPVVTNWQMRKALRSLNRMADFKAYFNSLPEDEQEDWQFSYFIDPASAMVQKMKTDLALNNAAINTLFRTAATQTLA